MKRSVLIGFVLAAILFVWMAPCAFPPVFGQATSTRAPHIGEGGLPQFERDPAWPKVPAKWKMGFGSAVAIDADDHVLVLSRPHTLPHTQTAMAAPPVMEFDNVGNFIQGWGGESGPGYQWPSQPNSPWRLRRFRYGDLTLRCRGPRSSRPARTAEPLGTRRNHFYALDVTRPSGSVDANNISALVAKGDSIGESRTRTIRARLWRQVSGAQRWVEPPRSTLG
jgi:hypothetical protein